MNKINDLKDSICNEFLSKDYTHFCIDMCSLLEQVCKVYFSELNVVTRDESLFNQLQRISTDVCLNNIDNFGYLIRDRNNIVHQRVNYSYKMNDTIATSVIDDYNRLIGKIRYRHRKILLDYKIELKENTINKDYEELNNSIALLREEIRNLSSKFDVAKQIEDQHKFSEISNEIKVVKDNIDSKKQTTKTSAKLCDTTRRKKLPGEKDDSHQKQNLVGASHKCQSDANNYLPEFIIDNGVLIKYNGSSKKVVLPSNVTEIGEKAFYCSYNYCLHKIRTAQLEEIDLTGICKIGQSAFHGCEELKSVIFDKSLQTIGERAFYGCRSLGEVIFPESLKIIERHAFDRCESLQTLILPDSLTYLGFDAFGFCSNLKYVSIGKNLHKQISFSFCNNIEQFDVSCENKFYKSIDGNVFSKDGKMLVCSTFGRTSNYLIPEHCERINMIDISNHGTIDRFIVDENNKYFSTIDNDLYDLNREMLIRCSDRTRDSFKIPDSVTSIHPLAFGQYNAIKRIIITNDVKVAYFTQRHNAVFIPNGLCEVEIENSVTDISWLNVFGRSNATPINIIYHGSSEQWTKIKKYNEYEKIPKEVTFV